MEQQGTPAVTSSKEGEGNLAGMQEGGLKYTISLPSVATDFLAAFPSQLVNCSELSGVGENIISPAEGQVGS